MNQEKLKSVLGDKTFAEKIIKLQTPEEVQAAFKEKGVELSVNDVKMLGTVINKMVEKGATEISEEDLKDIAGGSLKTKLSEAASEFAMGAVSPVLAPLLMMAQVGIRLSPAMAAGMLTVPVALVATGVALDRAVPWAYNKLTPTAELIDPS